nr:hypothetical protein B0A51_11803 [Rachicladosporium sp. CCFEE 5018]
MSAPQRVFHLDGLERLTPSQMRELESYRDHHSKRPSGTRLPPSTPKASSTDSPSNAETMHEIELDDHPLAPSHTTLLRRQMRSCPYESLSPQDEDQIRACYTLFYWSFFVIFVIFAAIVTLGWVYVGVWEPERAHAAAQGVAQTGREMWMGLTKGPRRLDDGGLFFGGTL